MQNKSGKNIKTNIVIRIAAKIIASFCIAAFVVCVASFAVPFENESVCNVYKNTVRLRVVANSDSVQDTELKYLVRNDIIGVATEIFKGCTSIEEAKSRVYENMDKLEQTAKESVLNHGYSIPVYITFGTEKAPVKRYSEFTFPAGEYMTLRVNLGEAKGENWWCVMYPPLCVSASTNDVYADTEVFLNHGFSKRQVDELLGGENDVKIRFKLLDILQKIF